MRSYRKRIERDLGRWRAAGWVTPDGEAAIRREVAAGGYHLGLANSLAILAAVLIGFAVMSFVAANWQEMPRLLRVGMLLAALWGCYVAAVLMAQRNMTGFAHAAVLAGVGIFGGSIMLISQMYHMDGNVADFLLVWAGGAFLAGLLLRSNPSLAFAMVLVVIWGITEAVRLNQVFWPFLLPWAVISAVFYWQRWRPGLHLSGIALSGFVISLGYMRLGEETPRSVDRIKDLGLRGIKVIRPLDDYDSDEYMPLYARAASLNLPMLFHLGIVARGPRDRFLDVSMARMRPVHLDRIARNFDASYVFQGMDDLLTVEQKRLSAGRTKPWGTVHALLCARDVIAEPFAVINADDYYGREAFQILGTHLSGIETESVEHAMVGYVLRNTMSRSGTVSRAICSVNDGYLVSMKEHTKIGYEEERIISRSEDGPVQLSGSEPVSMNFFGFAPTAFESFTSYWEAFINANVTSAKNECYLPNGASAIVTRGEGRLRFYTTDATWFGMTYSEDRPIVKAELAKKVASGVYPEKLWSK